MNNSMRKVVLPALIALLIFQPLSLASAQTQGEIRINLITTLETQEAMLLKLYFNLYDASTGTPVLSLNSKNAEITLIKTGLVSPATIKAPDVPIYVTLVLDSSGSMGGSAQKLQEAAKLALNNTPDDAWFGVVQFDEEIKLLQDFTENIPAVSYAVDQYKVSNKGTCLYDAAYAAVEAQSKAPPGRRAVILFTDGKDEKRDGSQCSQHSYQELITLAMKMQVPIHAIGLSTAEAKINELELRSMASSTGGFSFIASQADLNQAFGQIMDALRAQWMVEATVYPKKGQNEAVFTLTLADGGTLNTAFSFNSETDYPGPPSPVTARFAGLMAHNVEQTYEVQLDLTSPELVGYVKIEIWDQDSGSKVGEYVFEQPEAHNSFLISTEPLTMGHDYELRIIAVNKDDNVPFEIFEDEDGKRSTQMAHEFNFDPSASFPTLEIQSLTQDEGDLAVTINVTNPGLIGGFDGWLVDEETNTQVPNSNFAAPAFTGTTGTINIPARANRLPDGKYTIVVRALAKDNKVYSTAAYENLAYKAPSIFERLGVALIAAPVFLFSILGIILAVVLFLMINSARQKSLSGTPVMQGRLGRKVKGGGKLKGPVLPVADDEPILSRSRTSGPSASKPVASTPRSAQPSPPPAPAPIPSRPISPPKPSGDSTMIADDLELDSGGATMIAGGPILPHATLTVLQSGGGSAPEGTISVASFPFLMGRTEGALTVTDPNVSRKHAQITYDAVSNAFYLTDLNSANGTRLNQQRLTPGQPVHLTNGAVIGLGPNVTLRFDLR